MKKRRGPFEPKPMDAGFALSGTVLVNVILSLGGTLALSLLAYFMFWSGQYGSPQEAVGVINSNAGVSWLLQIVLHFFILAAGLIYLVIRRADVGKDLGFKRFMSGKDLVMTIVYTLSYIVVMLVVNAIYISILQALGYDLSSSSTSDLPLFDTAANIILAYFAIACLPPFSEEIMFRGLALNGLRKLGKWPAVLISALLFSLMHMNPVQYLNAFGGGIVMGLVYWKTGSFWAGAIVHFLNNAIAVTESVLIEVNQVTDAMLANFLSQNLWVAVLFLILFLAAAVGAVICTIYFGRSDRNNPAAAGAVPMRTGGSFAPASAFAFSNPVRPQTSGSPVPAPEPPAGGGWQAPNAYPAPRYPYAFAGQGWWRPGMSPAQWAAMQERKKRTRELLIGLAVAAPGLVICLLMTAIGFLV